jgi:16S rRNA (guanine527-N7)-methyltransferase
MAQFYVLLMENQKKENFTRLLNFRDIAIKHFIDCRIVPTLTTLRFPLMDMGTGPGFPGIPLKFTFPEEKIILAEGVQRRVEFLKSVRETMGLKQLDIIGRNINPFFAYPVQGVITRAVEDVRNTLKNTLTCLQTGGRVYLMKGPGVDPEIPVAEEEVGEFFKLVEDHSYVLPKTSFERRLLVYEKVKMAPLPDFEDEPWPEDTYD